MRGKGTRRYSRKRKIWTDDEFKDLKSNMYQGHSRTRTEKKGKTHQGGEEGGRKKSYSGGCALEGGKVRPGGPKRAPRGTRHSVRRW